MSLYHPGDRVVVKKNFSECGAGFVSNMCRFFGRTVSIKNTDGTYYKLEEDLGNWWWSDDCFEGFADDPDSDLSLEGLL